VDGAAVRRAVSALLRSKKLGRHMVLDVAQLPTGRVVFRHGHGTVTPASTMKLLTMTAALEALGPDRRFTTSVVSPRGSGPVVLVGGGDPLLARKPEPSTSYPARADLATLAARTARALEATGRSRVRLGYDTSLFTGPSVNPHWPATYIPEDVVSPITALWVDEGRERAGLAERSATPSYDAAAVFAHALEQHRIHVVGKPVAAVAPKPSAGGRTIARVRSAPLSQIVEHVVEVSDNEGAEVLARQVALAAGRSASFTGATQAVRTVLNRVGVSTAGDRIYDGSGLSREDRLRPDTLLAVIHAAATRGRLRAVVADLPVARFSGSLATRFDTGDPAGPGRVRAKTGTLTGVDGLAGTVTSRDGAVLSFVAIADRVKPVDTLDVRALLDDLTAALAGCRCAAGE
jgi:D-alanyl-D-alanine carboxypeptidase/D-alanyl-D-alanine-endopeptidase (penicillin-binding protein 4)